MWVTQVCMPCFRGVLCWVSWGCGSINNDHYIYSVVSSGREVVLPFLDSAVLSLPTQHLSSFRSRSNSFHGLIMSFPAKLFNSWLGGRNDCATCRVLPVNYNFLTISVPTPTYLYLLHSVLGYNQPLAFSAEGCLWFHWTAELSALVFSVFIIKEMTIELFSVMGMGY